MRGLNGYLRGWRLILWMKKPVERYKLLPRLYTTKGAEKHLKKGCYWPYDQGTNVKRIDRLLWNALYKNCCYYYYYLPCKNQTMIPPLTTSYFKVCTSSPSQKPLTSQAFVKIKTNFRVEVWFVKKNAKLSLHFASSNRKKRKTLTPAAKKTLVIHRAYSPPSRLTLNLTIFLRFSHLRSWLQWVSSPAGVNKWFRWSR